MYNCDVVGYMVWVSTLNSTEPREIMVEGGDTSMYEVMDLMPETTYSFSVAAVTLSGTLPYVMPGVMVTLPDDTGKDISQLNKGIICSFICCRG